MFTMLERSGRIGIVRCADGWNGELQKIINIVKGHFSDCNDNGFYPHPDEVAMQRELLAIPSLRQLAHCVGTSNAGGLDAADRNAVLYAIALCLGYPTSTDQRTRRVAWDVRARPQPPGADARFVTFSERTGSAAMHTDSSFYPMPEEQFLLYVVSAARCNGGASLLIDVEDVYQELQDSADGRAAFDLLSKTALPFRVPAIYAAGDDQLEYFMAPVFQRAGGMDAPLTMRWRHDSIMKGLAGRPERATPAMFAAVELVNQVVEQHAPRFRHRLPDDTLLWADNHRTLHGRADYQDAERHLIRIRISTTPNRERIGPSGVGAD
jgi:alpha-ketoglutarate-dependent taurine dioxygenase